MRLKEKTQCAKFFIKAQFSRKVIIVERWDYFFWIPHVISDQKHPFFDRKKFFFLIFHRIYQIFNLFFTFFTTTTSLSQLYRFRRKKIATHMLKMVAFTF